MGENTKIEWAHHTFNPWRGCTKVSEGCANCYADSLSKRNPKLMGVWGPYGTRVVASDEMWSEPYKWDRIAKESGVRARVFCASLADVFEEWEGEVHDHHGKPITDSGSIGGIHVGFNMKLNDIRRHLFNLIDSTQNLDWLLVTKRPENIRLMWPEGPWSCGTKKEGDQYRTNVWLLTSVENQEQSDKRIPDLLKCRDLAPILGLSCEPLLGPVDLGLTVKATSVTGTDLRNPHVTAVINAISDQYKIDWVIVGGESGNKARPMHPDWARSLRDQCQAADVPFFFKQWGEWGAVNQPIGGEADKALNGVLIGGEADKALNGVLGAVKFGEWHNGKFVESCWCATGTGTACKVGKKLAGRLLDGLEYSEFPVVKQP